MPLVLTRNTWPLAVMLPKMDEASPPTTRFSTTEELLGWMNCTYWLLPTENCCQLMMARWEDWSMMVWLAFGLVMVAEPATTWPPVGLANAANGVSAPSAP